MVEFIAKHIKTFILLVAIIIAGLIVYNIISHFKWLDISNEKDRTLQVYMDSTIHYRNANGELIAQRDSYHMEAKNFKDLADQLGFDKGELKEQVGNLNNLVSRLEAELKIKGEIDTKLEDSVITIVERDTVYQENIKIFNWSNDYLTLGGTIKPNDDLSIRYSYRTAFQTTNYWRRDGVFKPLHLVVDVKFDDPNAGAYDLNSIVVKPRRKRFYERSWFWFVSGVASGVVITSL
jgi:uncharacterized FlaG/YvyC family protein